LLALDTFEEIAVEERVGDVELMCRPLLRGDESEHCSDGSELNNRGEGLIEIHPRALNIPANDPSCLVPLE
jgi:hypothetical protein